MSGPIQEQRNFPAGNLSVVYNPAKNESIFTYQGKDGVFEKSVFRGKFIGNEPVVERFVGTWNAKGVYLSSAKSTPHIASLKPLLHELNVTLCDSIERIEENEVPGVTEFSSSLFSPSDIVERSIANYHEDMSYEQHLDILPPVDIKLLRSPMHLSSISSSHFARNKHHIDLYLSADTVYDRAPRLPMTADKAAPA